MAAVVPTSALTIREAASPAECGEISALFTSIWGGHQHIPPELGRAIVESGGYVVAARRGEVVVGASVGIVGQSGGHLHLHSHITGVVPSEQRSGVGLAIKRHQRDWAQARGMSKIVWTFDPLVRRNALFNLARLGAQATRYEVDFYGPVRDAINGEDDTDRLVVEWATSGDEGAGALAANDDLVAVPTPAGHRRVARHERSGCACRIDASSAKRSVAAWRADGRSKV